MNLCVIPARGGSKRILKKNIKNFSGKPIILWSIELAIKSKCFDKIIVSSDDQEIIDIAKKHYIDAPFVRPKELSDDFTGTVPVIAHAIKSQITKSFNPTYVCCLYATAPLIKLKYLKKGLAILRKHNAEYVFAATDYSYPIQRSFKILKNNKIEMFKSNSVNFRSQELEKFYHDAGQFYWGKTQSWLDQKPILSNKSKPIILPRHLAQDIDNLDDWKIAEAIFKSYYKNK